MSSSSTSSPMVSPWIEARRVIVSRCTSGEMNELEPARSPTFETRT